ncbi:hypothetical protein RRG08_005015 [Elysia crispata]|uniref:Uncharacterized protein n=1 Tax=Elysia crispata TaxID=231223 RepID=A0AAE1B3C0_9GAST|nr:hypothetical protein RRG08_005015 [Elysia crispata]
MWRGARLIRLYQQICPARNRTLNLLPFSGVLYQLSPTPPPTPAFAPQVSVSSFRFRSETKMEDLQTFGVIYLLQREKQLSLLHLQRSMVSGQGIVRKLVLGKPLVNASRDGYREDSTDIATSICA